MFLSPPQLARMFEKKVFLLATKLESNQIIGFDLIIILTFFKTAHKTIYHAKIIEAVISNDVQSVSGVLYFTLLNFGRW